MSIYVYNGTAWNEIDDFKRYVNGQWQTAELKRYNGTEWDLIWPCRFSYTAEYALQDFAVFRSMGNTKVSESMVVVGTLQPSSSIYYHDSLLYFPLDQMRQDMSGAEILSASLSMNRYTYDGGEDVAYVTVGHTLSGYESASDISSWRRGYTLLCNSHTGFIKNVTQSVSLDTSGIEALVNGTSDCLCLPTTPGYTHDTDGYAKFRPESIVLTVNYIA